MEVNCLKCNDTGWIFTNKGAVRCPCKSASMLKSAYIQMYIPERYMNASFDNFRIENEGHRLVVDALQRYVLGKEWKEGRGIVLYGDTGVGKTHLAISLLKGFYKKRGIIGQFRDTRLLLADLKKTFDKTDEKSSELLDEVLNTPILVLDDLGNERLSEWAKDILSYIIVYRYNHLKPIIITTNYHISEGLDSLEEKLGKPIASRIKGMCDFVYVVGEDKREQENEEKQSKRKKLKKLEEGLTKLA